MRQPMVRSRNSQSWWSKEERIVHTFQPQSILLADVAAEAVFDVVVQDEIQFLRRETAGTRQSGDGLQPRNMLNTRNEMAAKKHKTSL